MIREARIEDAAAINSIFNDFVAGDGLTDTDRPTSAAARRAWLREHRDPYFVDVCEVGGGAVGWTSLSPFGPRPSCASLGEMGVYLAPEFRRRGLGSRLIGHGLERAVRVGLRTVLAVVFARNKPSLRLFLRNGFEPVARLEEVAELRGKLEDVLWLAREPAQ